MTKNEILEKINNKVVICDGGFGSLLQKRGLEAGTIPAEWNITHPDEVTKIHREYLEAGAEILTLNTFGVFDFKCDNAEKLAESAFICAKEAVKACKKDAIIAYDLSSTGKMLKPYGTLPFEDAVNIFKSAVEYAKKYGADVIFIETMADLAETKAAVIAAKETCDLPIFVTNTYDGSGKLLTGADPKAMAAMLEALGVDALGVNCGLGPDDTMLEVVKTYRKYTNLPIIVNPNAGLPIAENGTVTYSMDPEEFCNRMMTMYEAGASILGGCCGTDPSYIKLLAEKLKNKEKKHFEYKKSTIISSYTHAVEFGQECINIGERINPTGKPKLKEALRNNNIEYLISEGLKQESAGATVLDVNVGLPEIDEREMLTKTAMELQAVCDLPLQLDSAKPEALESAMRVYMGKPLINSINGKMESMEAILPLVKKYGGVVIALTLDENGIPETCEKRVEIAEKILKVMERYGFTKEDVIFDPLTMPVSADLNNGLITLNTVKKLSEMGLKTSLGISNVSFGLPKREIINLTFLDMAKKAGLSAAIMNPFMKLPENADMKPAEKLLMGKDENCLEYIKYAESLEGEVKPEVPQVGSSLKDSIIHGLGKKATEEAEMLLKTQKPLEIIDNEIIPALDICGKNFESKKTYLPQLLMSADAATNAFDVLKKAMEKSGTVANKGQLILATVKGDIHDIGKNIVKVLLESYGFKVIDLGRDVPPELIVEKALETGSILVGLSALMTTTLPSMEKTVELLHKANKDIKVVVGGAVLTPEYAEMIHADKYSKEAMETVRYAQEVLG